MSRSAAKSPIQNNAAVLARRSATTLTTRELNEPSSLIGTQQFASSSSEPNLCENFTAAGRRTERFGDHCRSGIAAQRLARACQRDSRTKLSLIDEAPAVDVTRTVVGGTSYAARNRRTSEQCSQSDLGFRIGGATERAAFDRDLANDRGQRRFRHGTAPEEADFRLVGQAAYSTISPLTDSAITT